MSELSGALQRMVGDARRETAEAQAIRPLADIRRMTADAPPLHSFYSALAGDFGLIAEIKDCSPSMGEMLASNVARAPEAYRESRVVRAISVLTNRTNFGREMTMDRLRRIKLATQKPVLRKDFMVDSYQVYEARAFGADAILLMANILSKTEMEPLFGLAQELGMDVLFETHKPEEIQRIPAGAKIYGINCRSFESDLNFELSRGSRKVGKALGKDLTIDFSRFDYCNDLPADALKIAESGVNPDNCLQVRDAGFHSILVGTSLLIGPEAIDSVLHKFEEALAAPRPSSLNRDDSDSAPSR